MLQHFNFVACQTVIALKKDCINVRFVLSFQVSLSKDLSWQRESMLQLFNNFNTLA